MLAGGVKLADRIALAGTTLKESLSGLHANSWLHRLRNSSKGETAMRGKILLVVGLGVGYVLGTRAGREKYDELVARVQKVWNDPRVQKQANNVGEFVKDKAPDVADFVVSNVKKATTRNRSTAATPAAKTAAKPATRSSSTRSASTPASTTPRSSTSKS
jgi:hypothetical protein